MIGPTSLVVATLFALLAGGLVCIGTALKWEWRTFRRARNGCVVDGKVIGFVEVGGSPDDPSVLTLVEFRDGRGETYRIRSKWAESPAPCPVGQVVRVSYEAGDPHGADIVDRSLGLWLGGLGVMLTLIATILLTDILAHGAPVQ